MLRHIITNSHYLKLCLFLLNNWLKFPREVFCDKKNLNVTCECPKKLKWKVRSSIDFFFFVLIRFSTPERWLSFEFKFAFPHRQKQKANELAWMACNQPEMPFVKRQTCGDTLRNPLFLNFDLPWNKLVYKDYRMKHLSNFCCFCQTKSVNETFFSSQQLHASWYLSLFLM